MRGGRRHYDHVLRVLGLFAGGFTVFLIVRYLMIHELCHRRHMNHSRRYWSLVATFEPDWKPLDVELLKGWQHVPAWVLP